VCGICGIVTAAGPVDCEALARMTSVLRHRGPDDEGFFVSEPRDRAGGAGLGFRRLAIIDVAGGNQPLANEDGSLRLVFNGEIYNFRQLRDELVARGHLFATSTDSEVILHLYEDFGAECVQHLNGMFAFAVWDERARTLLLARDRLGKKPLYYAETPGAFLFGSELKSLLQHPACPREIDPVSLESYLALEYVPSPQAIVAGVRKLPAAHRLVLDSGNVSVQRYWRLSFERSPKRSDGEWVDEFRTRLREAVGLRLVSDVPLGAFLSGGVDSSAVVALMTELQPPRGVKTFSVGFDDRSFDESSHARRVAAAFGTDHHEERFTPRAMLDVLDIVSAGLDEPFGDASVLPTYLLSRFARQSVTVALGGDGGDELLAGYPTFPADTVASSYRFLPRAVHDRVVIPAVDRLPVSTADFSLEFKLKRFLRGVTYGAEARHPAWLGSFTPEELTTLLGPGHPLSDPYAEARRLVEDGAGAGNRLERLIELYLTTYLQDDILFKVDRASMLTSLEVRAPFLDYTLVEFLGRVPSHLKLRRFQTKVLLKRAMRGSLPAGIADRRKKGFGIPLSAWFRGELRTRLQDELSPSALRDQGIFAVGEVGRLVEDHLSGRRDNRKQLWTLFMFQLWYRNYVQQRLVRPHAVPAQLPAATCR
jgi:asparagine synthase (glutamine-hydrolysing)